MAGRGGRRGHATLACPETAAGQDVAMASFPLRWRRLQVATAHASKTVYVVTLRWARTSSSHSAHALIRARGRPRAAEDTTGVLKPQACDGLRSDWIEVRGRG